MFDPTYPANNTPATAVAMREQLNSLKALVDTQAAQVSALSLQLTALSGQLGTLANLVPIGGVISWFKDTPGVPALPANFVECHGQTLSDVASPLHGQVIRDLNGEGVFLRGAATSGGTGGADTHAHALVEFTTDSSNKVPVDAGGGSYVPTSAPGGSPYSTDGASSLPPYCEVVWIMRVK